MLYCTIYLFETLNYIPVRIAAAMLHWQPLIHFNLTKATKQPCNNRTIIRQWGNHKDNTHDQCIFFIFIIVSFSKLDYNYTWFRTWVKTNTLSIHKQFFKQSLLHSWSHGVMIFFLGKTMNFFSTWCFDQLQIKCFYPLQESLEDQISSAGESMLKRDTDQINYMTVMVYSDGCLIIIYVMKKGLDEEQADFMQVSQTVHFLRSRPAALPKPTGAMISHSHECMYSNPELFNWGDTMVQWLALPPTTRKLWVRFRDTGCGWGLHVLPCDDKKPDFLCLDHMCQTHGPRA